MQLPPISYDAAFARNPTTSASQPSPVEIAPSVTAANPFTDPSSVRQSGRWYPVVSPYGALNSYVTAPTPNLSHPMHQSNTGAQSTQQDFNANAPPPPGEGRPPQPEYVYTPWRPVKPSSGTWNPEGLPASTPIATDPKRQNPSPGSAGAESKPPSLSDDERNNISDRISDVIRGTNGAFASFDSARTAWETGRYEDTFYDAYRGVSNSMRALRGVFVLAGVEADQEGNKELAKSLKDTAENINKIRRWLDGLLYPLSGFRDVAGTFTSPSSTGLEKATSVADYLNVSGQFFGLAIPKLDYRDGDTTLKQFGYALTSFLAGIYGARNAFLGYGYAADALDEEDYATSAQKAIGATQDLVENSQYLVDFMADTLKSRGYKNLGETMKRFSTNLLDIGTAVYLAQTLINGLTTSTASR
jgi:hypothetical protein